MAKRRRSTTRYSIMALLAIIGLLLFYIVLLKSEGFLNKGELITSATKTSSVEGHTEKQAFLLSKDAPFLEVPKHPPSKNIEELRERIDDILKHKNLSGAVTGVSVRNEEDEILYNHHADVRLVPASNMKIITTVAALEVLGPDYQFQTEIKIDGEIKKGVLHGDLYLVGKGDPTLQIEDLDQLAEAVKDHGIKEIKGNIYADDSWYDDVRYSKDLSWRHEYNYVGNAISALNVSANDDFLQGAVIVDVYPGKKAGEKPEVIITPETDYIKIVNKGNTTEAGSPLTLTDEREHGSNELHIEGDIPLDSDHYQRWRAVWEPTDYSLHLFIESLKNHQIKFSKEDALVQAAPGSLETIVSKKSPALREIIMPFMKLSNNGLGEVLLKEMGKQEQDDGSWDSGIQVIQRTLISLGLNTGDTLLRDGSGMSERNLVSANFFTELLLAVQDQPWFSYFEKSFSLSGSQDPDIGGTLAYRLFDEDTKGKVMAKTGTLNKVSSLSGYVTTKDDQRLSFSILMNNYI